MRLRHKPRSVTLISQFVLFSTILSIETLAYITNNTIILRKKTHILSELDLCAAINVRGGIREDFIYSVK